MLLKPWAGATIKESCWSVLPGKSWCLFTFLNSVLWLSSAGHEFGLLESSHPRSTPGGRWLGVTALLSSCSHSQRLFAAAPLATSRSPLGKVLRGLFPVGTWHFTQCRESPAGREQRLSKGGTWALQGDSGFEQENPEAFPIIRSWDQPLVVAG